MPANAGLANTLMLSSIAYSLVSAMHAYQVSYMFSIHWNALCNYIIEYQQHPGLQANLEAFKFLILCHLLGAWHEASKMFKRSLAQ